MNALDLRIGSLDALARYTARQLDSVVPGTNVGDDIDAICQIRDDALERMAPILASVRNFTPGTFDHVHTLQYASYLYLLANAEFHRHGATLLADRLYALNRSLNAIDLFYAVEMPAVFFLSHALGTVLGNVSYSNRLVVFQGVTVGRVGEAKPHIGSNVVLYPGASVSGDARIGNGCLIGAGAHIHGAEIPADSMVVVDSNGRQLVRPRRRDYAGMYFRDES